MLHSTFACSRKAAWSERRALEEAKHLNRRNLGEVRVRAYECEDCKAWHVGRPSDTQLKRENEDLISAGGVVVERRVGRGRRESA